MHRIPALAVAFTLLCTSCEKPPDDPATRATGPTPEPAPAPAPGPGDAVTTDTGTATIHYACDDGSALGVRYVADQARVELPDGREVTLPKAQSASKGGDDAFVGEALALQRESNDIQLHRDDRPVLRCREAGT